jgi:hypothetical protein
MEGPGHCHSLFCQHTVQAQKELKQMALSLARVYFNFNKVPLKRVCPSLASSPTFILSTPQTD